MKYSVEFTASAVRDLQRLREPLRFRVSRAIAKLEEDPFPSGRVKIKGQRDLWRIRVGEHRVVYQVDQSARTIVVTIVRDRKEVYRDL